MSEIIWSGHIARPGKIQRNEDITIVHHEYSREDNTHGTSFGITFRNECYKQITKTNRIDIGLWAEKNRLYFMEATEGMGYRLSSNGASNDKVNRYCSIHKNLGRRHPEIFAWLMEHQGHYYLNFDKNGAYITPVEESIIWAHRA